MALTKCFNHMSVRKLRKILGVLFMQPTIGKSKNIFRLFSRKKMRFVDILEKNYPLHGVNDHTFTDKEITKFSHVFLE